MVNTIDHQELFNNMGHGVVYQDADGSIISANPAAEALLGLSLDQMQGRKSFDPRWRAVHPDGSDFPGESHPAMVALVTNKKITGTTMGVFVPAEDRFRWISIDAIPQCRDGVDKPYQVFTIFTDITENKQTERTLLEAETKWRSLTVNSPDIIMMLDSACNIQFINRTAKGLKIEDVINTSIYDYMDEESCKQARVCLKKVKHSQQQSAYSTDYVSPDGECFHYTTMVSPVIEDDRVTAFVTASRNDTDHKQALDALQTEKQRAHDYINSLPGLFYVFDEETFVTWNTKWNKITGYSDEELSGMYGGDFFEGSDVAYIEEQMQKAFIDGYASAEAMIVTKGGQRIPYLFYGERKNFSGKECLVGLGLDITLQRYQEMEHQLLLHDKGERVKELRCMYEVAELINTGGTFEEICQKVVNVIPPGWHYPEITCGRIQFDDKEYTSEAFRETEWCQCADIVVTKKIRGKIEVYYTSKCPELDEGPFLLEERNLINGIARALGVSLERQLLDKHRENIEAQLRQTQKMDAIGQLTGGIAHDFNNILGIILGNVSLLKPEVPTEGKIPKRVHTIEKSAQRAAELTRQLLSFSQKKAVDVRATNINRLIQNMDQLIPGSVTPGVKVERRLSNDLWLTEINQGDFEEALFSLVLNARDAIPDSGRITIETRNSVLDTTYCAQNPEATPGEYVLLSLNDTGMGITDEDQEHIFEPFFTTKPVDKGTGLGLSMVFGFVSRSGGHIEVQSEPGIGTTFNIYIPRAIEKEQEQEHQVSITGSEPEEIPKEGELILVVDDEPGLLELAQDLLQFHGYRVLIASNGKEALKLLVNNPDISLLFSDVVMPGGMNGYDLSEKAIKIHPGLKILLTSGHIEKANSHDNKKHLDANLISKPYSLSDLAQHVCSLLSDSSLHATEQDEVSRQARSSAAGIEWTENLAIDISPIDEDHKMLVELLNRSMVLTDPENAHEEFEQILKELLDYTQYHFKREEALMQACGYDDIDFHCQIHQFLINQVTQKQERFQSGRLSAEELVDFLNEWLLNHIEVMDRSIAPFCKGKDELIRKTLEQLDSNSDQ